MNLALKKDLLKRVWYFWANRRKEARELRYLAGIGKRYRYPEKERKSTSFEEAQGCAYTVMKLRSERIARKALENQITAKIAKGIIRTRSLTPPLIILIVLPTNAI